MSAIAVDKRPAGRVRFWESTIGKKAVMAATGLLLFGFVIGHLLGNLQIYLGPEQINHYAVKLREFPAALWVARLSLLLAVGLHFVAAVQLALLQRAARPISYVRRKPVISTYASRTMYWSGPIIALFIVYHLLHFTWGTVHPDYEHLKPYENVIRGFQVIPVSLFYIVAMLALGLHLYHGVWSVFQTIGINHPRFSPWLRHIALAATVLIVAGNVSIPVAVMMGFLK